MAHPEEVVKAERLARIAEMAAGSGDQDRANRLWEKVEETLGTMVTNEADTGEPTVEGGADHHPVQVSEHIHVAVWEDGKVNVTHDRGEIGSSHTFDDLPSALYCVAQMMTTD